MDVGFGLCPDKCYSKLVKAKFVTNSSSLPECHLIQNYFIIAWSGETPYMQEHLLGMLCFSHYCVKHTPKPVYTQTHEDFRDAVAQIPE